MTDRVAKPVTAKVTMSETHGTKAKSTPMTDEMVETMADAAERVYDVEEILFRRWRATEAHISVSEAVRRAIGQDPRRPLGVPRPTWPPVDPPGEGGWAALVNPTLA